MTDQSSRRRLRTWRRGDAVSAKHLNEGVSTDNNRRRVNAQPTLPASFARRQVVRCRVKEQHDNYLVCRVYLADEFSSVTINVAKPDTLRRSEYDGQTVGGVTFTYNAASLRDADDGVTTETQVVVPAYNASNTESASEILAMRLPHPFADMVANDGTPLEYIDMNTAARAWAKQAE